MPSDDKKKPEIRLKVAEARQEDVYKGIVRIDAEAMRKIGVKPGDVVEIEGKRKTVAIAERSYPEDVGLGIIRMDGILRRNAGVSLGEYVTVRKADVKEARRVVIAPAQKGVYVEIPPEMAKQALLGRPLMKGDLIVLGGYRRRRRYSSDFFEDIFSVFEEPFFTGFAETKFIVVDTQPRGPVIVTDMTEVEVLPQAVEVKEEIPEVTWEDIGDMEEVVRKVRELVELPLKHPEIFERLGIEPPKGILLYGPPGTGKTLLAKAVANETGAYFIAINGPEIVSKYVGESERRLREIFEEAQKNAPAIIFIDEIDAIAPRRDEAVGEVERRLVAQLLTLMDGLKSRGKVIVIAATNRPNAIDPALRRPGRFDREIEVPVPDERARYEILKVHTRNVPLGKKIVEKTPDGKTVEKYVLLTPEERDQLLRKLAKMTHGYVGADLAALVKEAAMNAIRRVLPDILEREEGPLPPEVLEKLVVTEEDFMEALKVVPPSAMREVLVEVPNVRWDDIGGLDEVKQMLKEMVVWPLKYREIYKKLGIEPPKGILLYGPPGTGKTLLAKAVATESGMNFIAVKGPEILSKWVGESIPGDEKVLAKIDGEVKLIEVEKLYEEWLRGKEIEVVSVVDGKVRWSKIEKISRHLRTSPVVEIITESGRRVKVTLDHSVFTVKDGRIISVPTSELKEGDWIVLINRIPSGDKEEIAGIKINENIAELIGLYIAEGDINKDYVRIHTKDSEIIKEIERIIKEEKLEGKYYEKDGSFWIKTKWFVELCKLFGVGAKNKRLGPALSLKKELLAKVLKGYFSGDGTFYLKNHKRSGTIEAVTVSKTLAEELLIALSMFGIFARIKERVNRVGNIEYRILIGRTEQFKIFLEEIRFIQEGKNRKLKEFIKSRKWTRGKRNIPAELVGKLYADMEVEYYSDRVVQKALKKVLLEDLYFDKIKEIRVLERDDMYVYDVVEVKEGHNFVGGQGFLLHNSEKAIREIFRKARQVAPCVIFFDEIDAIAARRGSETSGVIDRIVNQLLTEMDGITTRGDVVVIAATNRPDLIDPALLRPGRFDRLVYVPPPDKKARIEILAIHTRNTPLDPEFDKNLETLKKKLEEIKNNEEMLKFYKVSKEDVEKWLRELTDAKKAYELYEKDKKFRYVANALLIFEPIAEKTEMYSGADLAALAREAALTALRERLEYYRNQGLSEDEALAKIKDEQIKVKLEHFEKALQKVKPSITKEMLEYYKAFTEYMKGTFRKEEKRDKRSYLL